MGCGKHSPTTLLLLWAASHLAEDSAVDGLARRLVYPDVWGLRVASLMLRA